MKFTIDKSTGMMVPVEKQGLEFYNVVGGIKVVDNTLHTSFIILRRTDDISYAQGIVGVKGVNVFDDYKAKQIANHVKRVMPNSKYTDYHLFLRNYSVPKRNTKMTSEDKEILEGLVEVYSKNNEILNEDYGVGLRNVQFSDKNTVGKDLKGIKGALKAMPSMIIPFLICPPMAILQLIGAVHHRMEERYIKSKMNPKVWLDFIAMGKGKEQVQEAQRKKIQYYYSTLANGEILKVPAVNTIEAKDMILAISRKDIEPRYAAYDNSCCHKEGESTIPGIVDNHTNNFGSQLCSKGGEKVKMWAVKFNDGQVCYAFGNDGQRDEIMKNAVESRKSVVEYYKRVVLKGEKDTDNWKNKKMKHKRLGDKKNKAEDDKDDLMFVTPEVDDMFEIKNPGMYFPITRNNDKDFSTPQTSAPTWQERKSPEYRVTIGEDGYNPDIVFNIPATKTDEAGLLIGNLKRDANFSTIIEQQRQIKNIINAVIEAKPETEELRKLNDNGQCEFRERSFNICGSIFNFITFTPTDKLGADRQSQGGNKKGGGANIKDNANAISKVINQLILDNKLPLGSADFININDNINKVAMTIKKSYVANVYNKASKEVKQLMYKLMNNMSDVTDRSNILSSDKDKRQFSTYNKAYEIFVNTQGDDTVNNCEMINPETEEIMQQNVNIDIKFKQAV